jgi:hypothetical protein
VAATRFAFRCGFFRWLLVVLGSGPKWSSVDVDDTQMRVGMGIGFRATIPRASVRRCARDQDMRWGVGVHGWRGRWLVNGATTGIVTLDIDPPAPARVLGWPIRLRQLHVSVEDPDGLVAALAPAPAETPA